MPSMDAKHYREPLAPTRRYEVVNCAWRPLGKRRGLLRRRKPVQRSITVGWASDIETAAQILATTPFWADESVFIYDHANGGFSVGAKYGWKSDHQPPTRVHR